MTTSPFLSVPGISATVFQAVGSPFKNRVSDVDLELDGNFAVEQARDASEVLRRQNDPGNAFGLARFPGAALLHPERAAVVGAFREDGGDLLFGKEFAGGLRELAALQVFLAIEPRRDRARNLVARDLSEPFLVVPLRERFVFDLRGFPLAEENRRAGELSVELFEVLRGGDVHANRLRSNRTVGSGSPGLRNREELSRVG